MRLAPMFSAPAVIRLHAFAAIAAFALGIFPPGRVMHAVAFGP